MPAGEYEVEIELGKMNVPHIIRTVEYWESSASAIPSMSIRQLSLRNNITSPFLNVIGLFNVISLMALQMNAGSWPIPCPYVHDRSGSDAPGSRGRG